MWLMQGGVSLFEKWIRIEITSTSMKNQTINYLLTIEQTNIISNSSTYIISMANEVLDPLSI